MRRFLPDPFLLALVSAAALASVFPASGIWGEGVEAVCRKPLQFSCWNPGDPNLGKLGRVRAGDDPLFAAALAIARRALAGELPDPTGGATHYHAAWARPRWAEGRMPTARIGRHIFYRLT